MEGTLKEDIKKLSDFQLQELFKYIDKIMRIKNYKERIAYFT